MTVDVRDNGDGRLDAPLPGMVGEHSLMREVYRLVRLAAPTDEPVIAVGETGTGKELVARAIHRLSRRQGARFIGVNVAALAASLFESEVFGHERHAFSGAVREKPGLLELAHRGSVFLDELGSLVDDRQAKLLRVMEDGGVWRVGGVQLRPAAPRWIASAQALDPATGTGAGIRLDLWQRLAGVVVLLPPLRERASDIPALVASFLVQRGVPSSRVQERALAALVEAPWPGNVRELYRVLGRVLLRANGGPITEALVAAECRGPDLEVALMRSELEALLAEHHWDVVAAARALGVSRATLYRRLGAAGLRRPHRGR